MPLQVWQTRRAEQGGACASCGWQDVSGVLLCGGCRQARIEAQRAARGAEPPLVAAPAGE